MLGLKMVYSVFWCLAGFRVWLEEVESYKKLRNCCRKPLFLGYAPNICS